MEWDRETYRRVARCFESGDLDRFRDMIRENPRCLRNRHGGDAWLRYAAGQGDLPMVQLLVELGIDVNETQFSPDHRSHVPEGAIQQAADFGHLEVVRWLLDQGAEINFEFKGRRRCQPLIGAATSGYLDIVKLLVERGADLDASGAFAVTQADVFGNFAVRDYLLSVGAQDERDITPPDFPAAHQRIIDTMV